MLTRRIAVLGVLSIVVGLTGSLIAGAVSLDLADFDDDVMRGMDDTMKTLDSDISARDVKAVAADTKSISDGLNWAQKYFERKGGKLDDAIRWAKQGQELAEGVASSVQSGDFDTALNKYDSLVKNCRACHDVYKPPDI